MDRKLLAPFEEDFAMLVEGGFIAVKKFNEDAAKKLFYAAQLLRPEDVMPQIGLGYIHINKMEHKPAVKIFEKVCQKDPENELSKTFLGIAYLLSKSTNKQGETILKEVLKNSKTSTVIHLAKTSLEWNDKDLKDSKAPFFEE